MAEDTSAGPRFREEPWPPLREHVLHVLRQHRPYTSYGFGEADVTDTLATMRRLGRDTGIAVSLNAFVAYCIVQAALRHPAVLTYRKGRRLIRFLDVDLATLMDRRVSDGVLIPVGCILHRAQDRSLADLNWEFRKITRGWAHPDPHRRLRQRLLSLPHFLRRLAGWWLNRDPVTKVKMHGTIGLTSLNRSGVGWRYHALPPNPHTCTVALGGLFRQMSAGGEGPRRMLAIAVGIDHAILDGIPMMQFVETLGRLIESGAGLDDEFARRTCELRTQGDVQ